MRKVERKKINGNKKERRQEALTGQWVLREEFREWEVGRGSGGESKS